MRVGGRLDNSDYPYEKKHPIILPLVGHFTTLIVREAHERTLHGGTQLTLGTTRQEYWIVHGRGAVQKKIRRCMKCARFAARPAQQIMANLPSMRIQRDKCFVHCGVDYCDPLTLYYLRCATLKPCLDMSRCSYALTHEPYIWNWSQD